MVTHQILCTLDIVTGHLRHQLRMHRRPVLMLDDLKKTLFRPD